MGKQLTNHQHGTQTMVGVFLNRPERRKTLAPLVVTEVRKREAPGHSVGLKSCHFMPQMARHGSLGSPFCRPWHGDRRIRGWGTPCSFPAAKRSPSGENPRQAYLPVWWGTCIARLCVVGEILSCESNDILLSGLCTMFLSLVSLRHPHYDFDIPFGR